MTLDPSPFTFQQVVDGEGGFGCSLTIPLDQEIELNSEYTPCPPRSEMHNLVWPRVAASYFLVHSRAEYKLLS